MELPGLGAHVHERAQGLSQDRMELRWDERGGSSVHTLALGATNVRSRAYPDRDETVSQTNLNPIKDIELFLLIERLIVVHLTFFLLL